MKSYVLIILAITYSIGTFSQISFEKAYFISNADETIQCFIENRDWNNNPTEFNYKLSETSETETATIQSVKEFGIYNASKYVRATVNIDRSSSNINNLSDTKAPIFTEEELFLNVLVDGEAILYSYEGIRLKRYFFSINNSDIEQLVFKEYTNFDRTKAGKNNHYKQQLLNALTCPKITSKQIENLEYKRKDLVAIFSEFNACNDSNSTNYVEKRKRDLINLTLRPRINLSSLITGAPINSSKAIQLEDQTSFGFGIEFEYILPFNKNTWSLSVEPSYQSYKSEGFNTYENFSGGLLYASIDYKSLEIPVSTRHYFFLNDNSKLYANVSFLFDIVIDSSIEFNRANGSNVRTLPINTGNSYALGVGYKYKNKYSLEIRYQTNRELLTKYSNINSDYGTTSVIFGYSIF